MSQTMQIGSPAQLSPDVLAFASTQGVMKYLHPVLQMTDQVFRNRPITVSIDEDPEIVNDRHIIVDVDVTGLNAEQMVECQERWNTQVFEHCPSTHVCVFRLGMMDLE